jgi:hypothetical protein
VALSGGRRANAIGKQSLTPPSMRCNDVPSPEHSTAIGGSNPDPAHVVVKLVEARAFELR